MEGWQTQLSAGAIAEVEATTPRRQLTVLLPAYNEALAIRGVLEEIVEVLSTGEESDTPIDYEILVVDDASTDCTASLVEEFAAECWQCRIRVVRLPENRGAGAARKAGIREAHGETIVMMDADGTYPAAAIPDLLAQFPDYDQVNGARTRERGTMPWLRATAKWLICRLACYLTGKRIPDLNTGMKAFRRDRMLPWLWVVPDGFSCVTTMTLAFLTNGYSVKYVPIDYRRRVGVSKFHPVKDTLSYLSTVLRIVLYFRPLKVFLPLAAAMVAAGMAKSVWSFTASGSMQESDIVVLVAGFLTAMLGLLAEVIVAHHRR